MRAAAWIAVSAGLTVSACASVAPEDASDAPMVYSCGLGKRFEAAYALNGKTAKVIAGRKVMTLKHVRSASGAKYAGGGVELITKGAQATLEGAPGGSYRNCKTG